MARPGLCADRQADPTIAYGTTDALTVGGTATLELIDNLYAGQTFDFTVTSGATVAAISDALSSTAPNASVTLSGLDFGTYQITAVSKTASNAYWPPAATFTGTIEKAEGSISFDENPSKTYDSTGTKNGDGAEQNHDVNLAGCHILLCEDHPLNQEIAKALLEDKGAVVSVAEDGQRGLEVFKQASPGYSISSSWISVYPL